jgi:hypothetical protein
LLTFKISYKRGSNQDLHFYCLFFFQFLKSRK